MEILKISWRIFLLALSISIILPKAGAQDNKLLQEAFSASYSYEKSSNFDKAIESLQKVYDEQSYELNVRLGWLNYNSGNHNESIHYYTKALQLKPYSIEARLGYVLPASVLGNWNMVLSKYLEILKIDEGNYPANYRTGLIYYNRKEYSISYKYFEKIANMYPFDYDAVHMFAWANYRLGKLREAKVLFNKALLINPGDKSSLEGLSLIK